MKLWIYKQTDHSLSIKAAAPIPEPMHIETIPLFALVLLN